MQSLSSNFKPSSSPIPYYQTPSSPIKTQPIIEKLYTKSNTTYPDSFSPIQNIYSQPNTDTTPITNQHYSSPQPITNTQYSSSPMTNTRYSSPQPIIDHQDSLPQPITDHNPITLTNFQPFGEIDQNHSIRMKVLEIINNPNIQQQFISQEEYNKCCLMIEEIQRNHYLHQNFQSDTTFQPLEDPFADEFDYKDTLTIEKFAKKISLRFKEFKTSQEITQRTILEKLRLQSQTIASQTQEIRDLKRKLDDMEKTNKSKKGKSQESLKPFNSPINLKNIPTVVSPPSLQLPNQKAGEMVLKFVNETGRKNQNTRNVKELSKEILQQNTDTHIKIKKKSSPSPSPTKKQKTKF